MGTMETMHRIGVFLAAAVLAGCVPPGGTDDAGNRQCTAVGCGSSFQLAFDRPATWAAGTYVVEVTADGAKSTCEITMPLACDRGPRCTGTGGWAPVLSGCALAPAQHALTAIVFDKATPATIEVRVLQQTRQLGAGKYTPAYKTSEPNGPGCGTCRTAPIEELSLTP
jgi:hypothetical protein